MGWMEREVDLARRLRCTVGFMRRHSIEENAENFSQVCNIVCSVDLDFRDEHRPQCPPSQCTMPFPNSQPKRKETSLG